MTILELNIKAKRTAVAPVPPPPGTIAQAGQLVLHPDKKYITLDGRVVDMKESGDFKGGLGPSVCYVKGLGYYMADGTFTSYPRTDKMTIIREWFPTWKEHDAWIAGAPIILDHPVQGKFYASPYKTITNAFGAESLTVKEWWHNENAKFNPIVV